MKKCVAVAMGGYSSEYQISLNSGQMVCDSLDKDKYDVYPVHILKDGWYHPASGGKKIPVNKADFSLEIDGKKIRFDIVFNTVHGTPGEDGYLQAYWKLLKIPFTGSEFYPSALGFNKRDCLSVLKSFGIRCAESFFINKGDRIDPDEILQKTGLPCFVKPNRAGSSFGVSKVSNISQLLPAIEKAFSEDDEVIIETALEGTEVQVGVFTKNKEIIALPATEIVTDNEFFDYAAKYLGESEEITPARISDQETTVLQEEAKKIYRILNMKGITRSDFILQDGIPYFLETNTTPGLSKESIVPKQVREAGMTLGRFFDILISETLN